MTAPLLPLIYRIHRRRLDGVLRLIGPLRAGGFIDATIRVEGRMVVQVLGLDRLLGPSLSGDLTQDLGTVIGRGVPYDEALQTASRALGRTLAAAAAEPEIGVSFEEGGPPTEGGFPLPDPLFRILVTGYVETRDPERIAADLMGQIASPVRLIIPDNTWLEDLDTIALRTLQIARTSSNLADLISKSGRYQPERTRLAWLYVGLLVELGLMQLRVAPDTAESPPSEVLAQDEAWDTEPPRSSPTPPPTEAPRPTPRPAPTPPPASPPTLPRPTPPRPVPPRPHDSVPPRADAPPRRDPSVPLAREAYSPPRREVSVPPRREASVPPTREEPPEELFAMHYTLEEGEFPDSVGPDSVEPDRGAQSRKEEESETFAVGDEDSEDEAFALSGDDETQEAPSEASLQPFKEELERLRSVDALRALRPRFSGYFNRVAAERAAQEMVRTWQGKARIPAEHQLARQIAAEAERHLKELMDPTRAGGLLRSRIASPAEVPTDVRRRAEKLFINAQRHATSQSWKLVLMTTREVVTLHPGQPEYHLLDLVARVANNELTPEDAETNMRALDDGSPAMRVTVAVSIARTYKLVGNEETALAAWQSVLAADPSHEEAKSQIAALKSRRGFFKNLFSRR